MRIFPPRTSVETECVKAFISQLRRLIRKRDFLGILKVVSPHIDLDRFDGIVGIDNFILEYEHNQNGLWGILEFCLSCAGAQNRQDDYIYPYIHAPIHAVDIGTSSLIAKGGSIPVFADPNESSDVVVRLSYDVVASRGVYLDENAELPRSQSEEFHKLILADGSTAFGRRSDFLSPLDPYIVIPSRDGKCLLDAIAPSAIGPTFDHY